MTTPTWSESRHAVLGAVASERMHYRPDGSLRVQKRAATQAEQVLLSQLVDAGCVELRGDPHLTDLGGAVLDRWDGDRREWFAYQIGSAA